jgi:hypothetical protein
MISNATKGFGFPHLTLIGFQMGWSKAKVNTLHVYVFSLQPHLVGVHEDM